MPENSSLKPEPPLKLGKYRHFKGGEYEVIMLACDEATHEWMVVYRALYDTGTSPKVWVRRYDVFTEMLEIDGISQRRFSHM